MKILIKNAKIVNINEIIEKDILIEDERILEIGEFNNLLVDKTIEAKEKYILPGFIDLHTHLRTPGREDEEDLSSGAKAASHGGFIKIFCMPNTEPCIDNEGLVKWIIEESKKIGLSEIIPIAAITRGRKGEELTEFSALRKAGCLFLSDDGESIKNSLILRRALEYAKMFDLRIISHCEDINLGRGAVRESFLSSKYGLSFTPALSETLMVSREIEMARYLNSSLHLTHISGKRSIELIRHAKEEKVKITCDTTPHYLILTLNDIEKSNFDSNFKVNPPLGEEEDKLALQEALRDGIIDCITTDHAPHSLAEKELPFEEAAFGMIGLELAFSLLYTYLVKENIIELKDIVKFLSFNPAKIIKEDNLGTIKKNNFASLVILNLNKKWKVEKEKIFSKSKNTPFLGKELYGVIELTMHKGKIIYSEEDIV